MSIPPNGYPRAAAVSPRLQVVESTGSTNADLLRAAAASPEQWPHLSVVLTTDQRAGRGRLDRAWTAPPGTASRGLGARARGRPARRLARVDPAHRRRRHDARRDRAGARHRAHRGPEVAQRRAAGRRQAVRHPRGGRAGRPRVGRDRSGRQHTHDRARTCRSTRRPPSRPSGSTSTRIACSRTTSAPSTNSSPRSVGAGGDAAAAGILGEVEALCTTLGSRRRGLPPGRDAARAAAPAHRPRRPPRGRPRRHRDGRVGRRRRARALTWAWQPRLSAARATMGA